MIRVWKIIVIDFISVLKLKFTWFCVGDRDLRLLVSASKLDGFVRVVEVFRFGVRAENVLNIFSAYVCMCFGSKFTWY